LLICLALLASTVIVYWPVGRADYLTVDDHLYVSENKVVQAGLTRNGLGWAFGQSRIANYHPVALLSHMLDCELFGTNAKAHHLVNLAFHTTNSILLFFVLRRMTGREGASAFVAALFALHPQHVESVAWISERKDVLSGFFWILTLGAYAWYVERGGWWRYAVALLTFALGLLSKPMLVTLPCVLLLLDFWPLRRTPWLKQDEADHRPWWQTVRPLVLEKIPFFALAALGCVATVVAQRAGGAVLTMEQAPLALRLGNSIVSYLRYLKMFFLPTDLAAFYPLERLWLTWEVLAAVGLILAVTATVTLLARRRPYLAVGWLWFLGTLVPVIGVVQVGNQAMADRYMYLPMIGLGLMIAWGAADLLARRSFRLGAASLALGACAVLTAIEVPYWHDGEKLFSRALERTEPNVFSLHNVAAAQIIRGDYGGAIGNYQKCIKLQPGNPHVRRALGYALQKAGRLDEAHEQLVKSLRLSPKEPKSWDAMGDLYLERGKWSEAADHYDVAVELKVDEYESWINLAVARRKLNQPREAAEAIRGALRINDRLSHPWYMLGRLHVENGDPAAAIEPLQRAVALEPTHKDASYQLGLALMRTGRGAEAITPLLAALNANPTSPEPLVQLAWLLATHPNPKLRRGEDAMFLATRADALTRSASPQVLEALAAAQAELRKYDEAAATADRAAKLARDAGDAALADKIESHAAKYRVRSAFRDQSLAGADAAEVQQ
jgi:protein O-mannosyl-transferase